VTIEYHSRILAKIRSGILENRYDILVRKNCKDRSKEEVEEEVRIYGEGRIKLEVASTEQI
jgi:hypothetical protein